MAKTMSFTYKGKDYSLEYTRRTVREMEREGFVADDIDTKPMTMLPALFAGAFKAHHRFEKPDVIEEIYGMMKDKVALIQALAEMYNEPLASLMDEPDESQGNVEWTTSW